MSPAAVSRRNVFAATALVSGLAAGGAEAAEATPAERANLKLVEDFCATWGAPDFDPDAALPAYIGETARVRVTDASPYAVGPKAVAASFKPFLIHGERFRVKMLATMARGPVVVTHRIDTMVTPGKPDQDMEVIGLFVVRQGRIQEWSDYLV